ncbi:MAG: branched-chain-amino-acid transaminase [Acidimicrobiia bacterium]|nr:branched-chain-amino-acid transaminase [Acidimicrobiia bacterium]
MLVYVNGKLVSKEDATVSVLDHGFLYGDGVFEGIRVYDGNIFRMEEHIVRLYESAKTLALEIPLTPEEMTQATLDTVAANGKRDAYIRLIVSRGPGDLGIDPHNCTAPSVIIIVGDITLYPPELYETGIELITSSVPRIPIQCLDPRIKSLNYLNNILAKIDARRAGVPEALMLNLNGRVAECTADNIFIVKNGKLETPDLMQGALGGVTRAAVLDLAREAGIETVEAILGLHDIYNAEECFLTGTGAEVMPVVGVDGRRIGDGKPGMMTYDLLRRFRELRIKDGARVDYNAAETVSG